jgi:hypothetical protein
MLKQVSVFAENKSGRVHAIMETLKSAQINARAMMIAETAEFGIVRLIVNDPEKAKTALKSNNFKVRITDVIGFTVPDKFGAFCDVLKILGDNDINIEYSYSLMGCSHGNANILIYVKDSQKAADILKKENVSLFTQDDIL